MHIGLKIVLSAGTTAMHAPDIAAFLRRLLSARRVRGLFLQLFALSAALSLAMHLFKFAALSTDAAGGALGYYINPQDMGMAGALGMGSKLLTSDDDNGRPWLPLALAYLVAGVAVQSAAYIAAVAAAVVAFSGPGEQRHTLPSLLRKVVANGSLAASAFALGCALKLAVVLASAAAVHFVGGSVVAFVVVPGAGVLCAALVAVQAVAVAASVAEPGGGAMGAVRRACRLMRGKYAEGFAAVGENGKLGTAFWVLRELVGMAGLPGVVEAAVKCLLATAERMASLAVLTGYYFECRKRAELEAKDKKAGHQD